jgi:2'-5' RNA ligase
MRTFIATDISEEIRSSLTRIISHLKYSGADVKWVDPANIHLTLKFLGEVDEKKLHQIKATLEEIGKFAKPFEIGVKDIGAFPKIEYPRVIWVGLGNGASESVALAGEIDEELSKLDFEKESRPFAPHLTIGRVRSAKNRDNLIAKLNSCPKPHTLDPKPSSRVSSVVLYQSTLTAQGSIYTKLHEAKFLR